MVMNAIQNRKSVRKYSEKEIDDKDLRIILDAGRLAPSWINIQPWKFVVVKNHETKKLLSASASFQPQVKNADTVICCVVDLDAWSNKNFAKILHQRGLDQEASDAYLTSSVLNPSLHGISRLLMRSVEQISYAIAYMTLQAEELGIGACVVGAISNELTKKDGGYIKKVKLKLGLNGNQILISYLTLGYELENVVAAKKRKSFDEVVSFEKIGQKF